MLTAVRMTLWHLGAGFVFTALTCYLDLRYRSVPNVVTLGTALFGLLLNGWLFGVLGLTNALIGGIVWFGVFFVPWTMGIFGGADVKVAAAVGCLMGLSYGARAIILGVTLGGACGLLTLVMDGECVRSLKLLFLSLKLFLVDGVKTTVPLNRSSRRSLAYAACLALGALFVGGYYVVANA